MHQHGMATSDVLIDVQWWLHLTLQNVQDWQVSNYLYVAKILIRQCTKMIRGYGSQPKAVTFQELLGELSDFLSNHGLHRSLSYILTTEDWLDGGYQCRMRLMHFKSQDPRTPSIISLYFRVRDSSGVLSDRTLETRLYHDAEMRLSTGNQAYIVVGGDNMVTKDTGISSILSYVRGEFSKQLLEPWQKTILQQPFTVFLRDGLGNVALSVSKLLFIRLNVALMMQGFGKIRPAINLPIASQARIASSQRLRVRKFLSP